MVLQRNLAISWGLHMVDTLLLVLYVQKVLDFDWWAPERVTKGVPAQDQVVKLEMDCFGDSVAK